MQEVSADKAYLSTANLQTVVDNHAQPYIPFKANGTRERTQQRPVLAIWKQMFHLYSYNTERFMEHYHKRSNAETTFHMIKAKFGIAFKKQEQDRADQ